MLVKYRVVDVHQHLTREVRAQYSNAGSSSPYYAPSFYHAPSLSTEWQHGATIMLQPFDQVQGGRLITINTEDEAEILRYSIGSIHLVMIEPMP